MLNDPVANALSNVVNHERIGKREVLVHPANTVLRKLLSIMNQHGYVGQTEELTTARGGVLKLHLLGAVNKCGAVKPRFAVKMSTYEKFEKRYLPAFGVGMLIVSTPKGIMTHDEAKKQKLGGRLIAYCY